MRAQLSSLESIDALRSLLIRVGQLEQAIADAPSQPQSVSAAQAATDIAARLFCFALDGKSVQPHRRESDCKSLDRLLSQIAASGTSELSIKVPEGFAFYALYPEQYSASAAAWASDISGHSAVVIGVRSIGTTLSGVVAETLRARAWTVHRITVRPTGDPFRRIASISSAQVAAAEFALIVDEGPGFSGSSMVAIAEALVAIGFRRERIVFFPGHEHGPSGAVTPEISRWWRETRQCVTPLERVQWNHNSLHDLLCADTEALIGSNVASFDNLSAGAWRKVAYLDEADWPVAFDRFERTKFLVTLDNGRRLLWKFAGLTASSSHGTCADAHKLRFGNLPSSDHEVIRPVQPVKTLCGFDALPWVEGVRLHACDGDADFLRALSRYLIAVAQPADEPFERTAALDRLAEMLAHNTDKSLGARSTELASDLARQGASAKTELPLYGDGRLAPCEFVRTADGRIWKTDSFGHDMDHTIVGKQCILWDVAGAIVEWNLTRKQVAEFMAELQRSLVTFSKTELDFHCAAYAAFRLGMATMCALTSTGADQRRLDVTAEFYRAQLSRILESCVCASPRESTNLLSA